MDKNLKELIKSKNLSDLDLINLINSTHKDSNKESEDSADSKEQNNAEKNSAEKENSSKMTRKDFEKMLNKSVLKAIKDFSETEKLPSQKPLKKEEPKAKSDDSDFEIDGFNLIS